MCDVIDEEGCRLGIDTVAVAQAKRQVVVNCKASLVRMGNQYDLEVASLHKELSRLALHDSLTGLANRSVLRDRLDGALARLSRHPVGLALAFMDLDDFKVINDVHGHSCGDELLVVVAARFANAVRPQDLVARLGGDEFVVLFEDLADPAEDAQILGERLRVAVSEPMEYGQYELFVTASIGVAIVQQSGCRADEVLAEADRAMYGVKRSGRNRVASVEMGGSQHALGFAMASELHRALERDDLDLHYQPQYTAGTRSIVGFEALLRWEHPERGAIGPLEFIPIAEESGLIGPIGTWALEEACRQAGQWTNSFGATAPRMAVDISVRQLADPDFVTLVGDVLMRTGLEADRLVLEITESILIDQGINVLAMLASLKGLGVRLSIDDFGAGYYSLSYLRGLPVDEIKIDRSFVQDVVSHGDTRVVGAVVRLAHDLGLQVVAEGVETEAELEMVVDLGIDYVQGFLLGTPMPAEKFT